jgi:outer membrane immunogenic protein/high affinity Mn2+ porin
LIQKRFVVLATACGALLAGAIQAMAADPIDPDVAVGRAWTGCYAGVNVGYVRGDDDATDSPFTEGPFAGSGASWNSPPGAPYETIGSDGSSAIGGVEVGCDYQVPAGGLNLVFGGAADFSFMNVTGEGTSAVSADTHTSFDADWTGTLRARVGLASPDVLFYATGGLAVADIGVRAFDLSTAPTPGTMDVSGGGTETGWVIGGGAEWRFASNWSISAEYLHFDFEDITATGPAAFPPGAFPRFENDVEFDTVRVGLKWRM